jgi:hypothetical protein
MFGHKVPEASANVLLESETEFLRHLDQQAHQWLGNHYQWYDKVRKAKKGDSGLFHDATMEEQMLATRAALARVTETLQTAIVLAYNNTVETVARGGHPPDGWPTPLAMPDRNNPPPTGAAQDTLVIAYHPMKFLNLARSVRDKGKGVPYYTDSLVKKLWMKVIGFYCEPSHWQPDRLGLIVGRIPPEAQLQEVQSSLGALKTEVDLLLNNHQPFKFGRARPSGDPNAKNSAEDLYKASDEEMVTDLYLQHFVLQGLDTFIFRYYLMLMGCAKNLRVPRMLSHMFLPLLHKTEEIRQQFQGSFLMERDKSRLRGEFQTFFKEVESRPPFQVTKEHGKEVRRIQLSHRWLDLMGLPRTPKLTDHQRQAWSAVLRQEVLGKLENSTGYAFLLELLNSLVIATSNSVDGKLKAAKALRDFAFDQEKLGLSQIARKRRAVEENKRKILRKANKFKVEKQFDTVKAYEDQAAAMEAEATKSLDGLQQAVLKRKEALLARVEQLEKMAKEEGEQNTGRAAANIYELASAADTDRKLRTGLLPFLAQHLKEEKDEAYNTLYRFLFGVLTDLTPTEKMMLRKVVSTRMKLEDHELAVSDEEVKQYQQQILTAKTELNMEVPGLMDLKMIHGPLQIKLDQMLDLGLDAASLNALLHMPLSPPNKAPVKLPLPTVRKVLALNHLMHPIPEHDLLLPNVEADAPLIKRINFNRLAKLP